MQGQMFNVDSDLRSKEARRIKLEVGKDFIGPKPNANLKLGSQKEVSIKTGSQ